MTTQPHSPKARPEALAERVYQALKDDIFAFRLMPGDRFSESEIAGRMAVSRTPVRQALFRLEREGDWKRLETIVSRMESGRLRKLSDEMVNA